MGSMPNAPANQPDNLTIPPIIGVSTATAAFIGFSQSGPLQTATAVPSFAQYTSQFGALEANSELSFAAMQFFENGGNSLYVVRTGASGGSLDLTSAQTAFQALEEVATLNLLCFPGSMDATILAAARSYCEKRRSFLIIDADPKATTAAQLTNLLDGPSLPRSLSVAVYAPWLELPNPLGGGPFRLSAPSGTVAGIYARTDAQSGVWKAPAGLNAASIGVSQLAATFSEAEAHALQASGLNLLRSFPNEGILVWGARTLVPAAGGSNSGYEYVPVRRLALFIEESILRGIQWAVFEPNGPALWTKLQSAVSAFLHGLYRQGAFQGTAPTDAYFVKCDATTTTQTDLDQGIVNIVVGFAPLYPAEFLILKIAAQGALRRKG